MKKIYHSILVILSFVFLCSSCTEKVDVPESIGLVKFNDQEITAPYAYIALDSTYNGNNCYTITVSDVSNFGEIEKKNYKVHICFTIIPSGGKLKNTTYSYDLFQNLTKIVMKYNENNSEKEWAVTETGGSFIKIDQINGVYDISYQFKACPSVNTCQTNKEEIETISGSFKGRISSLSGNIFE